MAIPVSISRSLLAGNLQVTAALIIALLLSRARVLPVFAGILALVVAAQIASTLPAFQETTNAFTARWELAAATEAKNTDSNLNSAWGIFQDRILAGFTRPLASLESTPVFGYGIGLGTNVGAQRISGQLTFLVGEGAWDATMGELGLPLGLAFLLWRLSLALWVSRLALRASARGNRLPLILLGASFLNVLGGQLGQPTGLGFVVVSAGLTLAACNDVSPVMVRLQPQPSALPT